MIKRILLTMTLFMLIMNGSALAQDSPGDVHKKVSNTISKEQKAQLETDDWTWEKRTVVDELRELKYSVDWKKYKQEKYRIYIKGVKENIRLLVDKKEELKLLRKQLEPYLEDVVDRLATFINKDIPFWEDDRQKRLLNLRSALDSYKNELSTKMRLVFEALQLETKWGGEINPIEDITLKLNGIETQVTLVKLGRVHLYYMSIDEKQIGQWNNETKQWQALPDDLIREFKIAFDMALAKKAAAIIELPLGAI